MLPVARGRTNSLSMHTARLALIEALLVGIAARRPAETTAGLPLSSGVPQATETDESVNVKVTMMEVERRRADRLSASSRKTSLVLRLCLPPLCEHRNACGESWGDVRGQLRRTLDDERRFFARSRRMTAHGEASCMFQYECIRPTLPMAAYLTSKSVDGDADGVRPG